MEGRHRVTALSTVTKVRTGAERVSRPRRLGGPAPLGHRDTLDLGVFRPGMCYALGVGRVGRPCESKKKPEDYA